MSTGDSSGATTAEQTVICVFCGASPGKNPVYLAAARALAETLHYHNIRLVYGGGTVGLMGEVAKTLVKLSGPSACHGIIPEPLVKFERGPDSSLEDGSTNGSGNLPDYNTYGKTTVVPDMHTRKHMMAKEVMAGGKGSGFIALPGGYGTLEELMEVATWNQLGIHERGVVVYNVDGYWSGLMDWVANSVEKGFVGESNQGIIISKDNAEDCVKALADYVCTKGRFKLQWGNE